MHPAPTVEAYAPAMKFLHWTTAALILALFVSGWTLTSGLIAPGQILDRFFGLHKSMGILVLILTLWRITVRAAHPAPALPATLRPWEITVVGLVHGLLYVLLVVQPLSGWMVYTLSTHKSLFLELFRIPDLPFVADLGITAGQLPFLEEVHGTLAGILALAVLLHIGAALKHHFVVRDDVLLRMSPARLAPFLRGLRPKP